MAEGKKEDKEEFICNICDKKFKNRAGLMGHTSITHQQPQKIDEESEEERADKKELSLIQQKILSRTQNQEQFSPQEIDDIQEKFQPIKQRVDLRNEVSLAKLEAEKKEFQLREKKAEQKMSEFENVNPNSVSIKDLIELEKIRALKGSSNQDNPLLATILSNQMQQAQQVQNQYFQLLVKNMEEARAGGDIEKFQKSYENIKKLADIFGEKTAGASAIEQFGAIAQAYKPVLESFLNKKKSEPEFIMPPEAPQSSQDEEIQQLVSPTTPQQMTEQEIEAYARTHDLTEQGYYSTDYNALNSMIEQSLGLGKFKK